jgi:hypothetical protein
MPVDIGEVDSVAMPNNYGYGFTLKESTGRRWVILSYKTEAEAKAAREKIVAATADAIGFVVSA